MHFLARRKSRALFGAQEESRVVADCDLLPQLSENLASSRTCCRKELRAAIQANRCELCSSHCFFHCSGFRVAPQVNLRTSLGLSFSCFGLSIVAVCHLSRSMAGGLVWALTRMPYVACRPLTRFFVLGVGRLRLYSVIVPWCLVLRSPRACLQLLGAQFVLPGLSWRPRVPLSVRRDLCFQFSTLKSLAALRLPPVW